MNTLRVIWSFFLFRMLKHVVHELVTMLKRGYGFIEYPYWILK